jgi:hypothetical protein
MFARFDGRVLSGAAAFVEVWTRLPKWRWAARAASLPGAIPALDPSVLRLASEREIMNFVGYVEASDSAFVPIHTIRCSSARPDDVLGPVRVHSWKRIGDDVITDLRAE